MEKIPMVDKFSKEQRSLIMSRIRSKNTKIEMIIRRELWKRGIRYRVHYDLPGTPDIVLVREKIAIFCDGCFWHGCPVCKKTMPKSRREYWQNKIERNIQRAEEVDISLHRLGWKVIHIWEHQLERNHEQIIEDLVNRVRPHGPKRGART